MRLDPDITICLAFFAVVTFVIVTAVAATVGNVFAFFLAVINLAVSTYALQKCADYQQDHDTDDTY